MMKKLLILLIVSISIPQTLVFGAVTDENSCINRNDSSPTSPQLEETMADFQRGINRQCEEYSEVFFNRQLTARSSLTIPSNAATFCSRFAGELYGDMNNQHQGFGGGAVCHNLIRDRHMASFANACAEYSRTFGTYLSSSRFDNDIVAFEGNREAYLEIVARFRDVSNAQVSLSTDPASLSEDSTSQFSCLPSKTRQVFNCHNDRMNSFREYMRQGHCVNTSQHSDTEVSNIACINMWNTDQALFRDAQALQQTHEEINTDVNNQSTDLISNHYLNPHHLASEVDIPTVQHMATSNFI